MALFGGFAYSGMIAEFMRKIAEIMRGDEKSHSKVGTRWVQQTQWSTVIYLSYNRNQTFQTVSNSRLPPKQFSISRFKTVLLLTTFTSPINPHFSLFIPDLFAEDGSRVGFPPSHLGAPLSPPCPSHQNWWFLSALIILSSVDHKCFTYFQAAL